MYALITGQGTRINTSGLTSHLDIVFCSRSLAVEDNFQVLDSTWGSDHFPILLTCKKPTMNSHTSTLETFYNFKLAKWDQYKIEIDAKITKNDLLHQTLNVEQLYQNFASCILWRRELSIPKVQMSGHKKKFAPFWNVHCTKAIQERRKKS